MKSWFVGAVFLVGLVMLPNVCRSDPLWGTLLQVEALGCAAWVPCDDQLFVQNTWVQTNLVISLSALASSVDGFGNPIRANASADASAMPGALHVNITADGLNGGIAGGVINESWKDTITPIGPGGPGSSVDFLVTFTVSGTLHATGLGYDDCTIGGPVASILAGLSGPASFLEQITDCGGTASNQSAVVSLTVGQPVLFTESVSSGIQNMAGHSSIGFSVGFYLDPLTPCASYSTASGSGYFSPNAAGPRLHIAAVGPFLATLSWPTNAPCYVLESAFSLTGPMWSPVTNALVTVSGDQFNATISSTNAQQFFRLRQ